MMMDHDADELVKQLEIQQNNRIDLISDTWCAIEDRTDVLIKIDDSDAYRLTNHAHDQVSRICDIPKRYYSRMLARNPSLLCKNINAWNRKRLMFRILDGTIRAVLSDQYRIINDHDVLAHTLKIIRKNHTDARIYRCDTTETRIYIKILKPYMFNILGNVMMPGILIQNSEVGSGSLRADPFMLSKEHGNGMIGRQPVYRIHKGRRIDTGIVTPEPDIPVNDLIDMAFDTKTFNAWLTAIRRDPEKPILKPLETIAAIAAEHKLTDSQKTRISNLFIENGERTKWCLAKAISMAAKEQGDVDEMIRFERIAGMVASEPNTVIQVKLT